MNKLREYLNLSIEDILFLGDSLFEGGNDSSVLVLGIDSIQVENVEETKAFITKVNETT